MRTGARGYLLKGAERGEVLRAIQDVADGEAIFSPMIAQRLTAPWRHWRRSRGPRPSAN
jgi:DNA-binding NarL/FixJ family response regulator